MSITKTGANIDSLGNNDDEESITKTTVLYWKICLLIFVLLQEEDPSTVYIFVSKSLFQIINYDKISTVPSLKNNKLLLISFSIVALLL